MKQGAVYVYYDPVTLHCVYTGSAYDGNIMRRHRAHLKGCKGLFEPWLRQVNGVPPVLIEKVVYDHVQQLFDRENFWMDHFETLAEKGGLNQVRAGGPDHSRMGHISAKRIVKNGDGFSTAWKLHPDEMLKNCIKAAAIGRKRNLELHPDHQSRAGKIGWKSCREKHNEKISDWGRKGGLAGGGQLSCQRDPTLASRRGYLGTHNRWHVARGVISSGCPLCVKESSGV